MFTFIADDKEKDQKGKHIFISYNHSHQDVVKKIAEKLKVTYVNQALITMGLWCLSSITLDSVYVLCVYMCVCMHACNCMCVTVVRVWCMIGECVYGC